MSDPLGRTLGAAIMRFRQDIQIMRAVAVLLVVIYHADIGLLHAGYLGVDVFFVVSGFLMTRIIVSEIDQTGKFRFFNFFLRRARRLLPATISTLGWTTLLVLFVLTPSQLDAFFKQALGVVTFTTNIILWQETGYFGAQAETYPLLHFWSLAVEEQFYFLLPLFLLLLFRIRHAALILTTLGSLALCFVAVKISPSATFYLLPTRAWEMLVGGLCAVYPAFALSDRARSFVSISAIAAIIIVSMIGFDPYHPRIDALLVVIATAIVIQARAPWASDALIMRGLTRIGDWSYSIYLVHWPLLSVLFIVFIGDIPTALKIGAVFLSVPLAALQYRFVEQRYRHRTNGKRDNVIFLLKFLAVPLVCVGIATFTVQSLSKDNDPDMFGTIQGLAPVCGQQNDYKELPECRTGENPEIIIWGDSYAAHLIPGLVGTAADTPLIEATRNACGPTPGLASIQSGTFRTREWGGRCLSFNQSVLDYVLQSETIQIVIWSSPFDYYLNGADLMSDQSGDFDEQAVLGALTETVDRLRATGKKVVIISAPPADGSNLGNCLKRDVANRWIPGGSCDFKETDYRTAKLSVIEFLTEVEEAGIPVIQLNEDLCVDGKCRTKIGDVPIYADEGHFSVSGSKAVAEHIDLIGKIRRQAK